MTFNIVALSGAAGSGKDTFADRFVEKGYCKVALSDPMKRFAQIAFGFTEDQLWGSSQARNFEDTRYFFDSVEWARVGLVASITYNTFYDHLKTPKLCDKETFVRSLADWLNKLYADHPTVSPRIVLQTLGTEWGRCALYPEIWVDCLYKISAEIAQGRHYSPAQGILENEEPSSYKGIIVPDVRFGNELTFFKDHNIPVIRIVRPESECQATRVGVPSHLSEVGQKDLDLTLFDVTINNIDSLEDFHATADKYASRFTE